MAAEYRTGAETVARNVHLIVLILVLTLTTLHVPLNRRADDAFREGAYLMYGVSGQGNAAMAAPVALRGGIERVPAILARTFCEPDYQIVCVRKIGIALTVGSVALYLLILTVIAGFGTLISVYAGIPAIAVLITLNGSASSPADLFIGAPGAVDLGVLAILYIALRVARDSQDATERYSRRWLFGLGVVAGFGQFWAYDRGIVGLVLLVTTMFGTSRLLPGTRPKRTIVSGLLLGLALSFLMGINRGFVANITAQVYWLQHSDIWWLHWTTPMMLVNGPAVLMVLLLLGLGFQIVQRNIAIGETGEAFSLRLLMIATAFYMVQMLLRPDAQHIGSVLAVAALLAAMVLSQIGLPWMWGVTPRRILFIAVCMVFVTSIYGPRTVASLPDLWSRDFDAAPDSWYSRTPRDAELVPAGLKEAADMIKARGADCTYSFSNEGLLYLLASTPPCSRFAYPVYITQSQEPLVIAELEAAKPPIILAQSGAWSNAVDGLSLSDRTPQLAEWLKANYPGRKMLPGGYEIRMREVTGKPAR